MSQPLIPWDCPYPEVNSMLFGIPMALIMLTF